MNSSPAAGKDGQRSAPKITISFPPEVMDRIDVAAGDRHMSRQDWIREAVEVALARPPVTDTERTWGVGELPGDAYLRDVIERRVAMSPHPDESEVLAAEYANLLEWMAPVPDEGREQTPYWVLAIGWVQARRAFLRRFGTTLRAVSDGRAVHMRAEPGFRYKAAHRTIVRQAGDLLHETDSTRRKDRSFAEADDRIPRCDRCWAIVWPVAEDLGMVGRISAEPAQWAPLREWTWDDEN